MMENALKKLVLGTKNRGKLFELRELLVPRSYDLVLLDELGIDAEVPETGETYAENAILKGRAYAGMTGLAVLSDDSGLEVDALGGAPGVRSARYLPQPGATDADRRRHLVRELAAFPRPWTARFCCVAVLAYPDGRVLQAEGVCPGVIVPEERGDGGFGYDPVFELENGRTMAEEGPEVMLRTLKTPRTAGSSTQVHSSGVGSAFPAASTARARMVCWPSGSRYSKRQGSHGPPSSEHWKVTSATSEM